MNKEKKLPHSVRVFIRGEKNKIRTQFLDFKKREELISELYKRAWGKAEKKEVAKAKVEAKTEDKKEIKKPAAKKEKSVAAK